MAITIEKKKDVIYRCIGDDFTNGILACGYMHKPTSASSQYHFRNDYYSCFIVLGGSGTYVTETGEVIPLVPGCLVQRIPGVVHTTEIHPDGNWMEFFISFGIAAFSCLDSLNLLPAARPICHVRINDSILIQCSSLLEKIKQAKEQELPGLLLKSQQILLNLAALQTDRSARKEASMESASIEEACRILSSDTYSQYSLEEVADMVHLSYETFRKQFRHATGMSPGHYRTTQNMKQAKLMLLSGVTIKEISYTMGYNDIYAFYKQFTKTVGMPPGQYIREHSVM